MTSEVRRIQLIRAASGLLAISMLLAPTAHADCAKDARGEVYCGGGRCVSDRTGTVWCSRFYEGDAQTTREGRAVCGRGRCEKNSRGEIFCSTEPGGAVLKDTQGEVRCYGACERASAEHCENTPAAGSG